MDGFPQPRGLAGRIDKPGTFDVYAEVAAEEPAGFLLMANDGAKISHRKIHRRPADFSNPAHRPIDVTRRGIRDQDTTARVTLEPDHASLGDPEAGWAGLATKGAALFQAKYENRWADSALKMSNFRYAVVCCVILAFGVTTSEDIQLGVALQ